MVEPLARGEHVDLDSGVTVIRGGSVGTSYDENFYKINARQPDGTVGRVLLEDEEIRQIAEAAGYVVRDP